jgi:hypothetical protein
MILHVIYFTIITIFLATIIFSLEEVVILAFKPIVSNLEELDLMDYSTKQITTVGLMFLEII